MVRIQKNLSWFRKAAVLYSVEKCSENLVVPILHQAFKHEYASRKIFGPPGETQKYLNLYWEATLRFRKKRQPYHKQKGSCIHFRNFYFHTCIIPQNTFPLGWSLRGNRKEPLGGILLYIVYYREYLPPPPPPPPTLKIGKLILLGGLWTVYPVSRILLRDWNMRNYTTQFIKLLCIIRRSELPLKCVCSSWNQVRCINSHMEAEICLQPPRIKVYTRTSTYSYDCVICWTLSKCKWKLKTKVVENNNLQYLVFSR